MKYCFAPLEGVTGYIFRNTYEEFFGGIDKYFTPFLAPNHDGGLRTREKNDVLPENNPAIHLVPQILTNHAPSFLQTAAWLADLGYEEVNLNLGCPSGTVTAKKKGAGLLGELERLEQFLDAIFEACPIGISIKTRIGMQTPEEFGAILALYNRYPLTELVIHPRVREEFYGGKPHWESFAQAMQQTTIPLCYNGDLFRVRDMQSFHTEFPDADTVMLGRGLLSDPGLLMKWEGKPAPGKQTLAAFHATLLERNREVLSGDRNLLFHMKELWVYLACLFTNHEKYAKKIRKATTLQKYLTGVDALFAEQELRTESVFGK
ncbi:MAG: tRNA-dihydrouridine synthase family protein [Eubacteriales bacterium]|nr:tRNA-dihydrouridine synthase family protein [Eubacteriales bacterium]